MNVSDKNFSSRGPRGTERGNAMIYVLVAVALLAALAFVLSRGGRNAGEGGLDSERAAVMATQIVQVSNQVKQALDQMIYSGTEIADFNFCRPSDTCFTAGGNIHKIFSADGGGMVMPRLPPEAVNQINTNPAPGWYLGMFNNVGWTPLGPPGPPPYEDVILTAHQIKKPVCEKINNILTGSTAIPVLTGETPRYLIDTDDPDGGSQHTLGPNADFTAAVCAGCEGKASLCVQNAGGTVFTFYNIIAQR